MNITCVVPWKDPYWQKLVGNYPSTVFHSPEWMQVLKETYNFDIRAYVLLDAGGEPRAGIPYCYVEDMGGKRIVSLPFSDFCDPLVNNGDDWTPLINKLLAEQHQVRLRCVHNGVPLKDKRFDLINQAQWHCVDMQPDLDTIWNNLQGSARRAINKARKSGIIVEIAQSEEELRAFFILHLKLRKNKFQLLAQPYRFFENIWRYFIADKKGALMVARCQDQIIGGVMFLEWQNKLYYKFNASNPDFVSLRPNDLIIWKGIKYGKSQGHTHLDFGLSEREHEGLLRYKRKYATDEKTIFFLQYQPEGAPTTAETQFRNLMPKLTKLFVDESVPDNVTENAGDMLYRFFT